LLAFANIAAFARTIAHFGSRDENVRWM